MADILERISNPLARSATSALMGASAAAILTGGLLGLTAIEDRSDTVITAFEDLSVHRLGTYAAVAGAIAGGAFGGIVVKPTAARKMSTAVSVPKARPGFHEWTDWRSFVVVNKVPESKEITSFYLKPQDGQPIPDFAPGQFLTIKLDIPDRPRPVIRTYSLSDYAESPDYYRLSIKREGPPKGKDVPPGIASNFMHDQIQ